MRLTRRTEPWPRWLAVLLSLAVLAGVGLAWRSRGPRTLRVLLLDAELRKDAGLGSREAAALGTLVKDQLEIAAGASISYTLGIPGAQAWGQLREDALVLRLAPRREGSRLSLRARWARVGDLRRDGRWTDYDPPAQAPRAAMAAFLRALPCRAEARDAQRLIPAAPEVFWDLLAAGAGSPAADYGEARALLEAARRAEPDCPTLHFALGELEFFHSLQAEVNDPAGLSAAEDCLERGLAACPRHPRGTWLLARLRTDTGSAREALELLVEARKAYPRAMPLVIGLTYAARYAGLLDFAARAEALTDQLAVDTSHPVRLQVTFLYRGEWDRYERTLWTRPDDLANSTVLMLRGQLELARGRRDRALEAFREASGMPRGYAQFIRLAGVFRAILEGRPGEAREELDALARSRVGLRVPDGEFILHMAEGYVLLGDHAKAQDLVEKAFYAGFTCARWYETDPVMAPLRSTARWASLMQHVKERQAILEARFPPSRWGL